MASVKLIDNWKKAWRMATVQIAAGAVAFGSLPPEVQTAMLGALGLPLGAAPAVLGVMLIIARVVDQPKTR